MEKLFQNAAFGVALTLISYEVGKHIQKRTGIKILSPFITGVLLTIIVLLLTGIEYNTYKLGGSIVSFFVGPATVSLAIPLYKNIKVIKNNFLPIIIGITCGLITGIIVTLALCNAFGINEVVTLSMLPKSVTSAIGYAVAEMIGGAPEITLVLIAVQGTTGFIVAEPIFKLLKIDNPVIKGISLGTNSHISGTAKAMELGETEGAMSSAAITIAGVILVFLIYILMIIIG